MAALVFSMSLCFAPVAARGQTMMLLGTAAAVEGAKAGAPEPVTEEQLIRELDTVLATLTRLQKVWPELAGTGPAGEPRFNGEDIGHIATSATEILTLRATITATLRLSLARNGVAIPADAAAPAGPGQKRFIDRDNNSGRRRNLSMKVLAEVGADAKELKEYSERLFTLMEYHPKPNPLGMAMSDWQGLEATLRQARTDKSFVVLRRLVNAAIIAERAAGLWPFGARP